LSITGLLTGSLARGYKIHGFLPFSARTLRQQLKILKDSLYGVEKEIKMSSISYNFLLSLPGLLISTKLYTKLEDMERYLHDMVYQIQHEFTIVVFMNLKQQIDEPRMEFIKKFR